MAKTAASAPPAPSAVPAKSVKSTAPTTPQPLPDVRSAWDGLQAKQIDAADRFSWQPPQLVAVAGSARSLAWDDLVAVAIRPDGKQAAAGGFGSAIHLFDTSTGQITGTLIGHQQMINDLAYSPDGKTLASASADGSARLWDPTQTAAKPLAVLKNPSGEMRAVAFTPDGKTLATAGDGSVIQLWSIPKQPAIMTRLPTRLRFHTNQLKFSPDGEWLAAGAGIERLVYLWKKQDDRWQPAGALGYRASDKASALFSTLSGSRKQHHGGLLTVAFSRDSQLLATAGKNDRRVWIWERKGEKFKLTMSLDSPVQTYGVNFAFGPDRLGILSDGFYKAALYHLKNAPFVAPVTLPHPPRAWQGGPGEAIAFDSSGARLVLIGGQGRQVSVYRVTKGSEFQVVKPPVAEFERGKILGLSPDGRVLAVREVNDAGGPGKQRVRAWRIADGKLTAVDKLAEQPFALPKEPAGQSWVATRKHTLDTGQDKTSYHTTVSADGALEFAVGRRGRYVAWNRQTGATVASGRLPGKVFDVAFLPDRRHVVLLNGDGSVFVLRLRQAPEPS